MPALEQYLNCFFFLVEQTLKQLDSWIGTGQLAYWTKDLGCQTLYSPFFNLSGGSLLPTTLLLLLSGVSIYSLASAGAK